MTKIILSLLLLVNFRVSISAQVQLSNFFGSNMVLQRNAVIPVWGWASPGEKITLQLHRQTKMVKADSKGNWMVKFNPEKAGGPYDLIVTGKNKLTLNNILLGDVWLCSGQSNMEWTVGQSNNAPTEMSSANYPMIRQVKIPHKINSVPEKDLPEVEWKVCDPLTVKSFTGVGYFFARNILENTNVPIGLVNDCWGGTNIETWISREGFASHETFKDRFAAMPKGNLDSVNKMKIAAIANRIEKLQNSKPVILNPEQVTAITFNDSQWPEMQVPQLWETQLLGEVDGVVWLRKSFTLAAEQAAKPAELWLSKIDDDDITYINGVKVGFTNQWDAVRKYTVGNGILKEGRNTIAIKITDNTGGGGIYGDADAVKLQLSGEAIPLKGKWKFQVESVLQATGENSLPSLCYNGMIAPILPMAFKGVLWYQGESNAARAFEYRKAFPLMIQDWRRKFGQGNFPFYFVQLASFVTEGNSNKGCGWAELREAQTMALQETNTGMVVTTDLVTHPTDIHPTNKQDVGKRLAAIALQNLYGKPMVCSGPVYQKMTVAGNEVYLQFEHSKNGLITTDKNGIISGFEIAGADQQFYVANATIRGNKVVLSADQVQHPVAVHFGWIGDATNCNLYNKEGFPAVPFRTDQWLQVTKEAKYTIEKF